MNPTSFASRGGRRNAHEHNHAHGDADGLAKDEGGETDDVEVSSCLGVSRPSVKEDRPRSGAVSTMLPELAAKKVVKGRPAVRRVLSPRAMRRRAALLPLALLALAPRAHAQEAFGVAAGESDPPSRVWSPPPTPDPAALQRRRSTRFMVGGIVLASLGLTACVGGVAMIYAGSQPSKYRDEGNPFVQALGVLVAVPGAGMLAGGGILIARGSALATSPAPVRAPQVSVGPGSVSLRWTF